MSKSTDMGKDSCNYKWKDGIKFPVDGCVYSNARTVNITRNHSISYFVWDVCLLFSLQVKQKCQSFDIWKRNMVSNVCIKHLYSKFSLSHHYSLEYLFVCEWTKEKKLKFVMRW